MLSNQITGSELFRLWEADQTMSFGLTLVLEDSLEGRQIGPLRKLLIETDVSIFGDTVLHQCASLTDEVESDAELVVRVAASKVLGDLQVALDTNHQVLALKGLTLLLEGHLDLNRFCQWAMQLSPMATVDDCPSYLWTEGIWQSLRDRANQNPTALALIDKSMSELGRHGDGHDRLLAACNWYSGIRWLFTGSDEVVAVPALFTRLGYNLINAQHSWPMQVTNTGMGIAVPLYSWLQLPNTQNMQQVENSVWVGASGSRFLDPRAEPDTDTLTREYRFLDQKTMLPSALCWNEDWHNAMSIGLSVGKSLWKSQTGRMDDQYERRRLLSARLCVEFSTANKIVATYNLEKFELIGASAQVYWTQVVLGLLLPAHRVPLATATGLVKGQRNGEFALGDVFGLEAKLKYASQSGFLQKMILPHSQNTVAAIERMLLDDEGLRQDILERNLCSSARDAADAMQESGWRRAIFMGAPLARLGFSQLTHDLFALEDIGASIDDDINRLTPTQQPIRPVLQRTKEAIARLGEKPEVLARGESQVLFKSERFLGDFDLGVWLGYVDHLVRTADFNEEDRDEANSMSGLGILCVRTRQGESDMRFWANIFDLLEADSSVWDRFQFGSLEDSCTALAKLLNNFQADLSISRMPAPDILVILDETGVTQPWSDNTRLSGDRRGSLLDLLDTRQIMNLGRSHTLADMLEPRDARRKRFLGLARILVICPTVEPNTPVYKWRQPAQPIEQARLVLDALKIFQSGFTIHSAHCVICKVFELSQLDVPSWMQSHELLQQLKGNNQLSYGRGDFYFTKTQRGGLDPEMVLNADLHEAAGVSFSPLVADALQQGGGVRRVGISVHQQREARWHFHQMYSYAKNEAQKIRARRYISLLGLVSPMNDWDTIKAMGFDRRRYGLIAFTNLGMPFLLRELKYGSLPHVSRFGLAINSASDSLAYRKMTSELICDVYSKVDQLAELIDGRQDLGESSRLYVASELAYFIRKFRERVKGPIKVPAGVMALSQARLESLERMLIEAVSKISESAVVHVTTAEFPLNHSWLEYEYERVSSPGHTGDEAWRYGFAMCLTDHSPTPYSWIYLVAAIPCNGAQTKPLIQALHVWQYRVKDKVAFVMRLRNVLYVLTDQASRRPVGIVPPDRVLTAYHSALKNLRNWVNSRRVRSPLTEILEDLTQAFEFANTR